MNCDRIGASIRALPLAEHRPRDRELIERHADSCPRCAAALAAEREFSAALALPPRSHRSIDLSSRILTRLAETAPIATPDRVIDVATSASRSGPAPAAWRPREALGWSATIAGLAAASGAIGVRVAAEGPLETGARSWSGMLARGIPDPVLLPTPDLALVILLFGLLVAAIGGSYVLGQGREPEASPLKRG